MSLLEIVCSYHFAVALRREPSRIAHWFSIWHPGAVSMLNSKGGTGMEVNPLSACRSPFSSKFFRVRIKGRKEHCTEQKPSCQGDTSPRFTVWRMCKLILHPCARSVTFSSSVCKQLLTCLLKRPPLFLCDTQTQLGGDTSGARLLKRYIPRNQFRLRVGGGGNARLFLLLLRSFAHNNQV